MRLPCFVVLTVVFTVTHRGKAKKPHNANKKKHNTNKKATTQIEKTLNANKKATTQIRSFARIFK